MVRYIANDGEFSAVLDQSGGKLVIVDFFATWCGPCTRIAPVFEQLSKVHTAAVFLKVDVDKCEGTAAAQGVSAMPTFVFFVNKAKVDVLRGADPSALETKVKQWVATAGGDGVSENGAAPDVPAGHIDLSGFLDKRSVECLNESDSHTIRDLFNGSYLESDCDEQLILNFPFNQPVKIHSIKFGCKNENGPKDVKLFINLPKTLDFEDAEERQATQNIEFQSSQLADGGEVINLQFVKFQNVTSLQIAILNNQSGSDITRVDTLKMYGSPLTATRMEDFKRVAGKKGEGERS